MRTSGDFKSYKVREKQQLDSHENKENKRNKIIVKYTFVKQKSEWWRFQIQKKCM